MYSAGRGDLSTDAGLLILRQFDEQQGFTAGFAEQLDDSRRAPTHSLLQMVRSRVFGNLAGYEDQNDHDALRSDAVFKLLAGRLPEDDDLASQPSLSRFENSVSASSLLRLEEWFLERFVNSFTEPPREITLDVDVFDDPTHGQQQLTFYHGFYEQYQYLVRAITCAENDLVVLPVLLFGTVEPSSTPHRIPPLHCGFLSPPVHPPQPLTSPGGEGAVCAQLRRFFPVSVHPLPEARAGHDLGEESAIWGSRGNPPRLPRFPQIDAWRWPCGTGDTNCRLSLLSQVGAIIPRVTHGRTVPVSRISSLAIAPPLNAGWVEPGPAPGPAGWVAPGRPADACLKGGRGSEYMPPWRPAALARRRSGTSACHCCAHLQGLREPGKS